MNDTCPFCLLPPDRILWQSAAIRILWDAFPASPGHALVVTTRHVETWWDATRDEQHALLDGVAWSRRRIEQQHAPDGFNIGVNVGAAAGQTVPHLHLHIIPRYAGDTPDPRGGIRHAVPGKGNPHWSRPPLITGITDPGSPDPLLYPLERLLAEASSVDVVVAFLRNSGLEMLERHLVDALARDVPIRMVVGDYLNATEAVALKRLLGYAGPLQVFVYQCDGESFHPKAWIFRLRNGHGVAIVGSSNISHAALFDGVEWNYSITNPMGFRNVSEMFERLLGHRHVRRLTAEWVDEYAKREAPLSLVAAPGELEAEPPLGAPEPTSVQTEALRALAATRREGHRKALVSLATGLGKTYLAAFDSEGCERVLFVAHREEILEQARRTFARVRPMATLGFMTGECKDRDADVLFASIQTLGRNRHLETFAPDHFEYVVIDEFHHAAAATYRRLLGWFTPKFLLCLTATPERTDGAGLLQYCDANVPYECSLTEGIRRGLLSPYRYFGVPDDVDYRNIPWRSGRFDEAVLTEAVATQKRAQNALEQWREKGGTRTLAFCCSQMHADFMAEFFGRAGVKAVAVHSGGTTAPRALSLEQLGRGELQVVFAVDMFNEGLDVPNIDTILMLRPTESRIVWLQQFGRGLRKTEGKAHVTVIDYIGNHRSFLMKPQALFDLPPGDEWVARLLREYQSGGLELPEGCSVTYELAAVDLMKGVLRQSRDERLTLFYEDFEMQHGVRPTALEAYLAAESVNPRVAKPSWLGFVELKGGFTPVQQRVFDAFREFLGMLERTAMSKSYKMAVLMGMLEAGQLPGRMGVEAIAEAVAGLLGRGERLARDFKADLRGGDRGALAGL
ncbi:MAG: DEAD/DEAH box helicase family protein [Candidatus Xenobia bacterium]